MDSVVAKSLGFRCWYGADREKGPLEKSLNATVSIVYISMETNWRPDSQRAKPRKVSNALLRYEILPST